MKYLLISAVLLHVAPSYGEQGDVPEHCQASATALSAAELAPLSPDATAGTGQASLTINGPIKATYVLATAPRWQQERCPGRVRVVFDPALYTANDVEASALPAAARGGERVRVIMAPR